MNRMTQPAVRKLKDGAGHYLWQPSLAAGEPSTLMGFPVSECEEMPDISAGAHALAFPEFRARLLGGEPGGVPRAARSVRGQAMRAAPYHEAGDGGVQDFEAIK